MIVKAPSQVGLLCGLLVSFSATSQVTHAEALKLKFENCRIALGPKVAKVHAGYCSISNLSPDPVALTEVTSAAYGRVELHLSEIKNGIASMRQLKKLVIGAGETIALKPEGLHLMLMQPKKVLKSDDMVSFEFMTAKDDVISVKLHATRKVGRSKGSHAGHANHKGSHSGHSQTTQ